MTDYMLFMFVGVISVVFALYILCFGHMFVRQLKRDFKWLRRKLK